MWSNKGTLVPVTMPFEKFELPRKRERNLSQTATNIDDVRTFGAMRYVALPPQGVLSGERDFERALQNPETQHRSLEQERGLLASPTHAQAQTHSHPGSPEPQPTRDSIHEIT
jgi:hypothetical protein